MNMQGFRISRCFKPESFGRVAREEQHHFADASQENGIEKSHICASFQGKIHCSFVMGKSRVRPLKNAVTLP